MNYYLVDYENVGTEGVKELKKIKSEDVLVIFYSERSKSISLDVINIISNSNIKLVVQKVTVGTKNALDFQLATYLGYLIGKESSAGKYYIVSKDKGFDCLCEHWKMQHVSVERILLEEAKSENEKKKSKKENSKPNKKKVASKDMASIGEIKGLLSEEDEPEAVLEIFNSFKTKQAICNGMSKYFKDSKRASAIYKKLKPLLKNKKKS